MGPLPLGAVAMLRPAVALLLLLTAPLAAAAPPSDDGGVGSALRQIDAGTSEVAVDRDAAFGGSQLVLRQRNLTLANGSAAARHVIDLGGLDLQLDEAWLVLRGLAVKGLLVGELGRGGQQAALRRSDGWTGGHRAWSAHAFRARGLHATPTPSCALLLARAGEVGPCSAGPAGRPTAGILLVDCLLEATLPTGVDRPPGAAPPRTLVDPPW